VYRLVGTPSRWPEVEWEVPQVPSLDSGSGPLPAILGVVAALIVSCGVLWFVRKYCNNVSAIFVEPEPAKPVQKNPEKPLKCPHCNRGFNTYPALTVHERRCEAAIQEAERIMKESQKSPGERLMALLGIDRPVPKNKAQAPEPTLVQVGSP